VGAFSSSLRSWPDGTYPFRVPFGRPPNEDFHGWIQSFRRRHEMHAFAGRCASRGTAASASQWGQRTETGHRKISKSTVRNILKEHGFDPGPKRGEGTWDEFIKIHANAAGIGGLARPVENLGVVLVDFVLRCDWQSEVALHTPWLLIRIILCTFEVLRVFTKVQRGVPPVRPCHDPCDNRRKPRAGSGGGTDGSSPAEHSKNSQKAQDRFDATAIPSSHQSTGPTGRWRGACGRAKTPGPRRPEPLAPSPAGCGNLPVRWPTPPQPSLRPTQRAKR